MLVAKSSRSNVESVMRYWLAVSSSFSSNDRSLNAPSFFAFQIA